MLARKHIEAQKKLELLVGGAVKFERKRNWLTKLVGFFSSEDLSFEQWQELERHPRSTSFQPTAVRDRYDHMGRQL
jgi:hypothetical protein